MDKRTVSRKSMFDTVMLDTIVFDTIVFDIVVFDIVVFDFAGRSTEHQYFSLANAAFGDVGRRRRDERRQVSSPN